MASRLARTSNLFILCTLLLPVVGGCGKPAPVVDKPAPVVESAGKPLTDEECLATADQILKAVQSGDAAALDRLIDWDAVNQACTGGVDAAENFRKSFIQGLDQSRLQGKGISTGIVDSLKRGAAIACSTATASRSAGRSCSGSCSPRRASTTTTSSSLVGPTARSRRSTSTSS